MKKGKCQRNVSVVLSNEVKEAVLNRFNQERPRLLSVKVPGIVPEKQMRLRGVTFKVRSDRNCVHFDRRAFITEEKVGSVIRRDSHLFSGIRRSVSHNDNIGIIQAPNGKRTFTRIGESIKSETSKPPLRDNNVRPDAHSSKKRP